MRFIHSADWQIGKSFRSFGSAEPLLQQARLDAIEAIGRLAMTEGVRHVLVAGDLYDSEQPARKTLLEPLERMRRYPQLTWHVISGNHDPHRTNGLWDRVRVEGVPANVHLHLEPVPAPLGDEAMLLPAPMRRKSETADLTGWMDHAATPPGLIRIGLAHGAVTGFGSEGDARNPIAADRTATAGLSYLALGDWHRTLRINERCWYAGAPEPDAFDSQDRGRVLLVEIAGAGAPPVVTERPTGRYYWLTLDEQLGSEEDTAALEKKLRARTDLSSTVLRLRLSGNLSVAARAALDERLVRLEAAIAHLRIEADGLHVRPTIEEIERIDFDGVLREAAGTLHDMAGDAERSAVERRLAEDALVELLLLAARKSGNAPCG